MNYIIEGMFPSQKKIVKLSGILKNATVDYDKIVK